MGFEGGITLARRARFFSLSLSLPFSRLAFVFWLCLVVMKKVKGETRRGLVTDGLLIIMFSWFISAQLEGGTHGGLFSLSALDSRIVLFTSLWPSWPLEGYLSIYQGPILFLSVLLLILLVLLGTCVIRTLGTKERKGTARK
ncbi:hypothetical protein B0T22DRAFT_224006 [Podospora appendiculata]|uniref:Transmembrane protein n=1 Tax=Podospora appendiculata TaxID=314037 RepID=A0AAE1CAL0_9PEZI|nr:hypothetical protein B0T22DRAFT_224006 [Podospora appendiculata]